MYLFIYIYIHIFRGLVFCPFHGHGGAVIFELRFLLRSVFMSFFWKCHFRFISFTWLQRNSKLQANNTHIFSLFFLNQLSLLIVCHFCRLVGLLKQSMGPFFETSPFCFLLQKNLRWDRDRSFSGGYPMKRQKGASVGVEKQRKRQ